MAKYYLLGIKGTGMSTLAQILYDLGNEVSGFDDAKGYKFTEDGLKKRGIKIFYDHDHKIDKDTIVSYSVAVDDTNPEMKRVKDLGLKIEPYASLMGKVIDMFETIGVSGTHGKTTTSSLIRHILEDTYGCNYFIGAGDGYVSKKNKYYVVESDEFNRHFLYYHPKFSIITNIEREHMEIYKDIDDLRTSFETFANNTHDLVVANGDNEVIRKINFKTKVIFYGFNDNNDIIIKNVKLNDNSSSFDLYEKNKLIGSFTIPLFGKHNIMNATASIIITSKLGLSIETIKSELLTFINAKRRFEITNVGDTVIVDDYAHHPTEIKATIEAARQHYKGRKIVAVFRPNTYSRTKDFKDDFIKDLSLADKVYMTEVCSNREKASDYPGVSSKIIADNISGCEMVEEDSIDKLSKEKGNVVLFLGCADNSHLISGFKEVLEKDLNR